MVLDLCLFLCVHHGDIAVDRWHPHGPRFQRLVFIVVACRAWYSIFFFVKSILVVSSIYCVVT